MKTDTMVNLCKLKKLERDERSNSIDGKDVNKYLRSKEEDSRIKNTISPVGVSRSLFFSSDIALGDVTRDRSSVKCDILLKNEHELRSVEDQTLR